MYKSQSGERMCKGTGCGKSQVHALSIPLFSFVCEENTFNTLLCGLEQIVIACFI